MASRNRRIIAGVFALAAAALAALAILAFGGLRVLRGGDVYRAEFEGSVYGLVDGANVYLSGVRVGTVYAIEVSPDDPRRVRVRIVVASGTPVRADTRAMLQFAGITGLKVIDLRGGTPGAPPLLPGSTIAAGETVLDKLEQRAEELADQTTELMARTNRILDNVARVTDPDGELVAAARRGAADLAAAGATLRVMADENRAAVRRSIDAVGHTARGADEIIAQLKGLIRDNGPALRGSMFDLRQASRTLKDLAREVRQRPSRLLFSGAQRERRIP
jgi:phospholipid/cholesterol/gamma-HCH transport system substrate-binding protein